MRLLIIIYLAFIGIGIPWFIIGAAWPSMYKDVGVTDSLLGVVSMITLFSMIAANLTCAALVKRFGPGPLITASMLIVALAIMGIAFSGNFVLLCVLSAPLGFTLGCIDTVLNNFVAVHYKTRHMNWAHCSWGGGSTAGPIIIAFGISFFGSWRAGYISIGIITFALTAALFLTLPLWKKTDTENVESTELENTDYREVFHLKGLAVSLLTFFCYCSFEMTLGLWGSSYMVVIKNTTEERAASLISLLFLGMTVGRLFVGFISIKLNNKQLIRLGSVIIVVGVAILFLSAGEVAYVCAFLIIGIGCSPIFPCLMHETPSRFGQAYSQRIVGLQIVSANIGNAVTPLVFGSLIVYIGYAMLPLFLLIWLVVLTVVIEAYNRTFKSSPL